MEFAIIMFIIAGICFGMAIYSSIKNQTDKKNKQNELNTKGEKYNAIYSIKIQHICGLPLVENSECIIHLCKNEIVIESIGNIFRLQENKILDMNIKTSKEVQNSISGAVGGYMLLGPIGAFLSGTTEFHRFFIIIYKNKENKEECISFDMKDDIKSFKEISKYIEEFRDNIKSKKEIDL